MASTPIQLLDHVQPQLAALVKAREEFGRSVTALAAACVTREAFVAAVRGVGGNMMVGGKLVSGGVGVVFWTEVRG